MTEDGLRGNKKLEPAHAGKLPVWAKGNAYFNGAKAWKKEENPLADTEHQIYVEVNCQDGKPVLSTNLYEFMGDYFAGMVNSDLLGRAFEPEQRFENPDGTDIVFDRDYLGEHRGVRVLPGPFASATAVGEGLWAVCRPQE